MQVDGEQLIKSIACNKDVNKEEAVKSFELFCGYYEERVTQRAVVLCERWKKKEIFAYQIVQCAFQKVWLYPTFNKEKSKIKNTDKAILNWINCILVHELTLLSENGDCSHPEAEDLPLITSPEEFIGEHFKDEHISDDDFEIMRTKLVEILEGLTEQEITIYLTYKLYDRPGKKMPRNVLKKLRARYGITQDAIKHCKLRVEQKLKEVQI